jgi:hypothetical protein
LSLFEMRFTTEALRRKKKLKKSFKKWMHSFEAPRHCLPAGRHRAGLAGHLPVNFREGSSSHPIGRGILPKRDR